MRARATLVFAVLAFVGLTGSRAAAEDASPWIAEGHVRARLVAGMTEGGDRWAALEMLLDPGFKTYWRDPGESGLPPILSWEGSTNLKSAELRWPAPKRLEDSAGVSNGYTGRVVWPVKVTPGDQAQPVTLALQADLGICHDICIPVRFALRLDLVPDEVSAQPEGIAEALARVPRPHPIAAAGPLSVLSVRRSTSADKPMLDIAVWAPLASAPQLFVEAPPNWFLAVSDPVRPDKAQPEERIFRVEIAERPSIVAGMVPITITLTAEEEAIESVAVLDAAMLAR